MATNVPPPVFGPNGFIIPSDAAILAGVLADVNAAFGGGLNLSLSTPQGQLATSMAAIISEVYQGFLFLTTQFDPAYAVGRNQDALARVYDLERNPAEATVVQATCTGAFNVPIPAGALAKASDGNIYTCTGTVTIPIGGSVTASFACNVDGPIACPAGSLTTIYQAISGWDSINNPSDGVIGQDVESRYQLEARRQATLGANARGINQAVLGAVLEVPGVLDAYVVDNPSASPATIGGVSISAHALYVAVVGGAAQAVAFAIWSKKSTGAPYFAGNTSATVQDTSAEYQPPFPSYVVTWETPPALQVLFAVNIVSSSGVPANAATLIQNAIISAFAGGDGGPRASIGALILASRYMAPVEALGAWAQVRTLLVGSANTALATFTAHILGTALTVISGSVTGTIAIGQTLVDQTGKLIEGTTILSGASLSWVVSNSQNVGASFTGTGSGTNLTASAVTGSILVGQTINGTGVPANTTIVSQTSGTLGGAGIYVTNNATTSSGAALTANEVMQGVVAASASVQANINQSPTINAAEIVVTVS